MAVVADVHTDLNSGQALEEAVGPAFRIIVMAPIDGQPTPAVGGVFSYYEFKQPIAQRLTDEAWQGLPESAGAAVLDPELHRRLTATRRGLVGIW